MTILRHIVIGTAAVLGCVLVFFVYSLAVTFSNWPWTLTETHREGEYLGFVIGSTKGDAFLNLLTGQRSGLFGALMLADQVPARASEIFQERRVAEGDFDRVAKSDEWMLGLEGCNCWLNIHFVDNRMEEIESKRYRGPSE